jgi:hypothetical protein
MSASLKRKVRRVDPDRVERFDAFLKSVSRLQKADQDSQLVRNLRIVLSPSVPKRSLRSTVAIYRLIELGADEAKLNELLQGTPGVLLRWFRVKEALCLSDSSCGLREFFL